MGLVGLLVTVAVMILGAGYFLFYSPGQVLTMESTSNQQSTTDNQQNPIEQQLSVGMAAIESAKNVKELVEQKAAETMEQGTEIKNQGSTSSEQETAKRIPPETSTSVSSTGEEGFQSKIINRSASFGFEKSSNRNIDTIILHSSYNNQGGDEYSVDKVIDIWKSYGVAPHYMIDRNGRVYRLVEDGNIAYHAGVSEVPDGRTNVNNFSIGIEMLNNKDDKHTNAQYDAVSNLIASLKSKYEIKYVLGHDNIAPGRKTDPWNFDWKKLK